MHNYQLEVSSEQCAVMESHCGKYISGACFARDPKLLTANCSLLTANIKESSAEDSFSLFIIV